jgi:large subunit ribosomal protein L21
MYAIVEIAGKQYRVEKDMKLKVARLDSRPGDKVGFEHVLYLEDEKGNPTIGKPYVKDMAVNATVIEHGREKKVIVFKKKRRKGYQKTYGHRQGFSLVEINKIGPAPAKKSTTAEAKPAAAEKKETKKTASAGAAKAKKAAPAKKVESKGKSTKAAAAKKPAAKKATVAKPKKPAAKKKPKEE